MDKKNEEHWIHYPICRAKTHTKVDPDTVLLNFPLYMSGRQFLASRLRRQDAHLLTTMTCCRRDNDTCVQT